jgi:hypothetical protein
MCSRHGDITHGMKFKAGELAEVFQALEEIVWHRG